MKKRSLGVNALLNSINTMLSIVFPLITYPYVARVLQVNNIGKVDFSGSVASYFVLIAGLGITTYAIREGSQSRSDAGRLKDFVSQIFTINLCATLIAGVLLAAVILIVPKFHPYALLIAVQGCSIFNGLLGVTWIYSIFEDYLFITIRSLVVHIAALVLVFLLVKDRDDYVVYAMITVGANLAANVFNFILSRKYVRIGLAKLKDCRVHLKPIMIMFASTITTTIYVNSDKTILGMLAEEANVGLYSVSVNIYTALKNCMAAIVLVSLPRLSRYLAENSLDEYRKTAANVLQILVIVLFPVVTGVFVVAEELVLLVGGGSYIMAATSLRILCIALMFSIMGIYYSNAVLLPYKHEKVVLKGTFISAAANIILNMIFIGRFKQDAAAATTLVAEFIMCAYQWHFIRNKMQYKGDSSFRCLASVIVGCVGIIITAVISDMFLKGITKLLITIIISVVIYFGVLVAINGHELKRYIKDFRGTK